MVDSALLSTDDAAVAAVLTSELSSNVVDHAHTPFTVSVSHDDLGALTVEVHDDSPQVPVLIPLEPGASRGRGLHLVDGLSQAWGVTVAPDDGKTVWFRLLPIVGPT
jgi:anti-sigma regulatory factor (Ser/Thr protein kinase)